MYAVTYENASEPFARFEDRDTAILVCRLLAKDEKRELLGTEGSSGRLIATISADGSHQLAN
jgi:hypothetical protein